MKTSTRLNTTRAGRSETTVRRRSFVARNSAVRQESANDQRLTANDYSFIIASMVE